MRVANWKAALRDYLNAARRQAFAYGSRDCAKFVAGAVQAQTGVDPSEQFGAYDETRAYQLLAEHGGVGGLATAAFGQSIPPNHCKDGDVVEAHLEHGPTLGICVGNNCAFVGDRALYYRPRTVILRGWRVQ